jgi:Sulphur transport
MGAMVFGLAFALAALSVGLMGFAIQRGGTCTVAAAQEWVESGRIARLSAMGEAALWVAGGLVLLQALGLLAPHARATVSFAATGWTVLGGALLGLGAWVNRACVFGAIARLGSGEWAYAATPIGFYLGCLTVPTLFAPPLPQTHAEASLLLQFASWFALPFAAFIAWRLLGAARRRPAGPLHPHAATVLIGITFLATLLLAGAWAYTDVLAELARPHDGMTPELLGRSLLLFALLGGALWGGWSAGRLRRTRLRAAAVLRCLLGGILMGWGSLLIPGGNDGLILIGLPLLLPYAWIAFATMFGVIALALRLQRRLAWAGA